MAILLMPLSRDLYIGSLGGGNGIFSSLSPLHERVIPAATKRCRWFAMTVKQDPHQRRQ